MDPEASGINKLPPALLQKIFLGTLPSLSQLDPPADPPPLSFRYHPKISPLEYLNPSSIATVSRRWNQIAMDTPGLWAFIVADLDQRRMSIKFIRAWLDRSKGLPLTFAFLSKGNHPSARIEDVDLQYFYLMFSVLDRVEHLYMYLYYTQVIDIQELGPRVRDHNQEHLYDFGIVPPAVRFRLPSATSLYPAPLLKSVFVHILSDKMNTGGVRGWVIDPLISALCKILASNTSSNFRHLNLQLDEQWGQLLWPLPKRLEEKPSWASVSKLQVTFIHPEAALVLLYSCPELVDLALDVSHGSNIEFWDEDGWHGGDREDDEDEDEDEDEDSWMPESSATLPLLHNLHLSSRYPDTLMFLFERIRAPALKQLELIFTDPRPHTAQFRQNIKRCMIRSRCKLEVLKLNIALIYDRKTEFLLPFFPDTAYCHTLSQVHLKQVTVPSLLELLSVSPNVTILEVGLECIKVIDPSAASKPRDDTPIRLASLQTVHIVHKSFTSSEGIKTCSGIDQFLRRIQAPNLKHLTIENYQRSEPWPGTEFRLFFNQTQLGVSYLHLRFNALRDSSDLLDILSHPQLSSSLQTLAFGGADELRLSDELLDYLTIPASDTPGNGRASSSDGAHTHALPALRHLIIAFSSMQSPGKLSSMVSSRFSHPNGMEYFRTTFYCGRYGGENDAEEDKKRLDGMKGDEEEEEGKEGGWDVDAVVRGPEIQNMEWVDEVRRRVGVPRIRGVDLD